MAGAKRTLLTVKAYFRRDDLGGKGSWSNRIVRIAADLMIKRLDVSI